MKIEHLTLLAKDGYALAGSLYQPERASDRTVIISGATAVKRRYYDRFARFLCSRGLTVLTFDYRGIGGSLNGHIKRLEGTMRDWAENDLAGVLEEAVTRFPTTKLLLVGHSAGGQFLGLAANNRCVSAVLAVSAQSGYWGHWSGPRRYLLAALWYGVMPALAHLCAYFPAQRLRLGENLPKNVALEWARWCRNRDFIVDDDGRLLREHFEAFAGPILAYSIDDDQMAPRKAVDTLMTFYKQALIERRHVCPREAGVSDLGHFGFFRESCKQTLWHDSADWLLQH